MCGRGIRLGQKLNTVNYLQALKIFKRGIEDSWETFRMIASVLNELLGFIFQENEYLDVMNTMSWSVCQICSESVKTCCSTWLLLWGPRCEYDVLIAHCVGYCDFARMTCNINEVVICSLISFFHWVEVLKFRCRTSSGNKSPHVRCDAVVQKKCTKP